MCTGITIYRLSEQESEIFHRVWFDIFRQRISHGFGDRIVGFVGIGGGQHRRESLNVCKDLCKLCAKSLGYHPILIFCTKPGLIFSPYFLLMGIEPATAVATSSTCVIFTSSSTTFQLLDSSGVWFQRVFQCFCKRFCFSLADILKSYWKMFRRHRVHWIARHHCHKLSSLVTFSVVVMLVFMLQGTFWRSGTQLKRSEKQKLCIGTDWNVLTLPCTDRGSHHHVIDVPLRPGELGLFLCRHLHGALPAGQPKTFSWTLKASLTSHLFPCEKCFIMI